MTTYRDERPPLDGRLSGAELRRWYWLRSELAALARTLGISAAGGKIALTDRLAAALDGEVVGRTRSAPRPPQLSGPVDDRTVIPPGQRCSQLLRAYFVDRVGPAFRFDATMRELIAVGGRTLGEAVDHWWSTRSAPPPEIGAQFELNRFTREWAAAHPDGSRTELLAAWRRHRSLPVEARPAVGTGG